MQRKFFYFRQHRLVTFSVTGSGGSGAAEQADLAYGRIRQELEALGIPMADLVRATRFFRRQDVRPAAAEVYKRFFPGALRPATSSIIVHDFLPADALIEIEATAILAEGQKLEKKVIEFDPPREPLNAMVVDNLVFVTGASIIDQSIESGAEKVYRRICRTLEEQDSGWEQLLHLSCYVKKIEWLDTVHKMYLERMGTTPAPVILVKADDYAAGDKCILEVEATAYR